MKEIQCPICKRIFPVEEAILKPILNDVEEFDFDEEARKTEKAAAKAKERERRLAESKKLESEISAIKRDLLEAERILEEKEHKLFIKRVQIRQLDAIISILQN